jgi:regulator of replication initiation timing
MRTNVMNEISSMESELESLRAENKILRESRLILDFENEQLKRRLAQCEEMCNTHLAGKVRLKTILDQAGQHLVQGIQRYNEELHAVADEEPEEPRKIAKPVEVKNGN